MSIYSNSSASYAMRCIKMMELLLMDGDELKDPELFEKALLLVEETRRSGVEKLRKEESKRLSLAAGLLLRYAFLSVNELSLYNKIEVTAKGKPFLRSNEYFFSLSHSGEVAICAFSDGPVGCDIEKHREKVPEKRKKIFSSHEENIFQTLDESEQIPFFFQLWTSKESSTKLIGKGISYPFESFTVMDSQEAKGCINLEGRQLFLKSFQIENYTISLSAETPEFPREIKFLACSALMKN